MQLSVCNFDLRLGVHCFAISELVLAARDTVDMNKRYNKDACLWRFQSVDSNLFSGVHSLLFQNFALAGRDTPEMHQRSNRDELETNLIST